MHRVVITGAGAVSSLGMDLSSNFNSLSEGKSGISKIDFLNSDRLSIKIGGQIKIKTQIFILPNKKINI